MSNRLKNIPLINQYEAYQYLNDEWNTISGDIEIIQTEGIEAAKVVDPNMVLKKKKEKEVEVQEGWIGHLLPFDLIQSKYLMNEKRELIYKENQVSEIDSEINDIIENRVNGIEKKWNFMTTRAIKLLINLLNKLSKILMWS